MNSPLLSSAPKITTTTTKSLPPVAVFGIAIACTLVIGGAVAGILYATRVIPHYPPNFDQVDPAVGIASYNRFIRGLLDKGAISEEKFKELQGSLNITKARWLTLALQDQEVLLESTTKLTDQSKLEFMEMLLSGSWY
jgi:hypothetical protein